MFNIQDLIDETKCYAEVRKLRWPHGVRYPECGSDQISKRGFHDHQPYRQRYRCQACSKQFDDLSDTIFEGHHQPLKIWMLCLYLMGLNLSNQQIAQELGLNRADVQQMTTQLRSGVVEKNGSNSDQSHSGDGRAGGSSAGRPINGSQDPGGQGGYGTTHSVGQGIGQLGSADGHCSDGIGYLLIFGEGIVLS